MQLQKISIVCSFDKKRRAELRLFIENANESSEANETISENVFNKIQL